MRKSIPSSSVPERESIGLSLDNASDAVQSAFAALDENSQPGAVKLALDSMRASLKGKDEILVRLVVKQIKERLRSLGLADAATVERAIVPATKSSDSETRLWPEDKPSLDPVSIAAVLDRISTTLASHVIVPEGGCDALALWIAHTYTFDFFPITPYLGVSSPTKGCGKTTLFEIVAAFALHSFHVSNATPATIFRMIEKWRPTLLLDEGDSFIKFNEDLRGILNSGHAKSSAKVVRCVGDDYDPTPFSTWCPKAFALIGRLPPTLEDRSVLIPLKRKLLTQSVRPVDIDVLAETAAGIRSALLRWSQDKASEQLARRPTMPSSLHNRAADNWRPLFSIAQDAGVDWPERAAHAVEKLNAARGEDEDSATMLLADIKSLLSERGSPLSSDVVVQELRAPLGK